VKPEELDAAEALVDTLTDAVITKEYSPAAQAQATRVREKAFLLLARTYGEIRDGVAYVRRAEGDVETIAPSLYGNRSSKRSSQGDDAVDAEGANDKPESVEAKSAEGTPVPTGNLNAEVAANGPFKRAVGED
jgi:hypothetical protein